MQINEDLGKKVLKYIFSHTSVTGQDVTDFISKTAGVEIMSNSFPMTSIMNHIKNNNLSLREALKEMFKIEEAEILRKNYIQSPTAQVKKKTKAL